MKLLFYAVEETSEGFRHLLARNIPEVGGKEVWPQPALRETNSSGYKITKARV